MEYLRIIPRLDIKSGNLIKGINLEGLRVLGDPNKFALEYYNQMTGNILSGKFKNNKVEYINLSGNAQMIYFNNQKNKNS